jgi:hypothetical protein
LTSNEEALAALKERFGATWQSQQTPCLAALALDIDVGLTAAGGVTAGVA